MIGRSRRGLQLVAHREHPGPRHFGDGQIPKSHEQRRQQAVVARPRSLGTLAGFAGGLADEALTSLTDVLLTVPGLVLAIAVVAAVGASAAGLGIAITVSFVPLLARPVRARVLELRSLDFIEAARAVSARPLGIVLRHVLPNAATVIVVELSLMAGQAVLMGSALGFLGLGIQPPAPEWGAMLGASRQDLSVAPFVAIGSGLAISLLVLALMIPLICQTGPKTSAKSGWSCGI